MSDATPEATAQAKLKPSSAPPPAAAHGHDDHGHDDHGHGDHGHDPIHAANPHLAHHFDTPQQQFDAGKLGIWLFLLTEVLFFAGLFCAYTIYRAMRPEVFVYAHYFLDTKLGAINTCVLLLSSLTAAWAVRNAQLRQHGLLKLNIVITILCACTFMVVKYFEYSHKYHDGLLPGPRFAPKEQVWELEGFKHKHPEAAEYAEHLIKHAKQPTNVAAPAAAMGMPAATGATPAPSVTGTPSDTPDPNRVAEHMAAPAGTPEHAPSSHTRPTLEQIEPLIAAGILGPKAETPNLPSKPRNAHVFFSIYFFMTGLHGFHVLIGIGIWVWMLLKANRKEFGPNYFGPIDYTALYWHLVDLIWIYLFPLLYLIH
jgi:cytochrome c oxidase subunit III